jgi:hypothetical protein
MADTEDLKSSGGQPPCGFESRPRHHLSPTAMRTFVAPTALAVKHQIIDPSSDFGCTLAVRRNNAVEITPMIKSD